MVDGAQASANYLANTPIIDVTYGSQVAEEQLLRLARTLPHRAETLQERADSFVRRSSGATY
jgi:hypothetical protein